MIQYADIGNFIDWFFTTVWDLGYQIYNIMDNIIINSTFGVSLLDVSIIILFTGIIFSIVLNAPGTKKIVKESERKR